MTTFFFPRKSSFAIHSKSCGVSIVLLKSTFFFLHFGLFFLLIWTYANLQKIFLILLWYTTTTGHQCRIAEKFPLTQYPLRHIHRASKNAQALSRLSSGGDQRSVSHILRALPTFFVSISECLGAGAFLLFNAIHKFCQLHCFFSHFLERIHIHGSELFCSKFLLSLLYCSHFFKP